MSDSGLDEDRTKRVPIRERAKTRCSMMSKVARFDEEMEMKCQLIAQPREKQGRSVRERCCMRAAAAFGAIVAGEQGRRYGRG
jgi:PIN domain nuclease of toxin-antitoxin system